MLILAHTSASSTLNRNPWSLFSVLCQSLSVNTTNMEVQRGVRKARKRKSLLKKAKKYGKKGKFGRGVHLDEDVYQYFVRVLELVETNKFETDEEKGS
jgi:hypothetical protein